MDVRLLLQTRDQPQNFLKRELIAGLRADPPYPLFEAMVAFVKNSGVNLLREDLERYLERGNMVNWIVGIDFDGTDSTALEMLRDLQVRSESSLWVRVCRVPGITFHPKFYWFQDDERHKLIVGSSNCTAGGISTNVEMSTVIDVKQPAGDDVAARSQYERLVAQASNAWDTVVGPRSEISGYLYDVDADLIERLQTYERDARNAKATLGPHPLDGARPTPPTAPTGMTLIMELTWEMGRARMTQVQPPIGVWTHYFGLDVADLNSPTPGVLHLTDEESGATAERPISAHDHTWTVEVPSACGPPAIIVFRRTGSDTYTYRVHEPTSPDFGDLRSQLDETVNPLWHRGRKWITV